MIALIQSPQAILIAISLIVGLLMVLAAADAAGLKGVPLAALATAACLLHAVRWALWQPWKTLKVPLVWVLHCA